MRILSIPAACFLVASFMVVPSQAGVEVVASKSLTVQPSGPRSGDAEASISTSRAKTTRSMRASACWSLRSPRRSRTRKSKA